MESQRVMIIINTKLNCGIKLQDEEKFSVHDSSEEEILLFNKRCSFRVTQLEFIEFFGPIEDPEERCTKCGNRNRSCTC